MCFNLNFIAVSLPRQQCLKNWTHNYFSKSLANMKHILAKCQVIKHKIYTPNIIHSSDHWIPLTKGQYCEKLFMSWSRYAASFLRGKGVNFLN